MSGIQLLGSNLCRVRMHYYFNIEMSNYTQGSLMHSGNHTLLLRLPATKLSEDLVTGEGKSDSLTLSLLIFFWPWLPSVMQCHCVHSPSSLYLSGVPRRGFIAQSSMAGRLMRRPHFSDSWHLPGDSPWHAHVVGFTTKIEKKTDNQTAGNAYKKKGPNCILW